MTRNSMAESILKDFKGKMDWVYVGKSEAPKPKETKADTLFNEYMQKVFDVASPVAKAEIAGASDIQSALAKETVGLMGDTVPEDKSKFVNSWLELEKKYSSPNNDNRLGKLLTSAVYMAGSFGLNYGSEEIANRLFRGRDAIDIPGVHLKKSEGDMRMLSTGWEYLTDYGIEKASDRLAQSIANREDIGFISPLTRAISKIGNSIMSVTRDYDSPSVSASLKKSLLNPGFIEGAFRFAGAVPGFGFIKEFYGKANKQIMKGEGIIPLGAELAFNMVFSKMAYRMQNGGAPKE